MGRENILSYTAVEKAVCQQVDSIIAKRTKNLGDIKAISIDEFAIIKKHKFGVVIFDPINKEIVDILPSRKKLI
jgi:transposase